MVRVVNSNSIALELALEIGFDMAGIAPLRPPADADRFLTWLSEGYHAGMDYLERNQERITHPEILVPGGRSMLVVGLGHGRPAVELQDGARIARYAAGRDYHNVMGRMLRKLSRRLEEEGLLGRSRRIVDAGPLLERSHGAEAGIGFPSKAANLLHPDLGPWFFLGELLIDVELEPTPPPVPPAPPLGSCGTCTACLDVCPTGAIRAPGLVDANLCLSYHTIENRGTIPHGLRRDLGSWAFGCDLCSEVCPWGQGGPDHSERLGTHSMVAESSLVDWLKTDSRSFATAFEASPLQRPKRAGLLRNACLVLGNRPSEEGRQGLIRALDDPAPTVRAAAAWGLLAGHGEDRGTRESVSLAMGREADTDALGDMSRSLAGEGLEASTDVDRREDVHAAHHDPHGAGPQG